MARNNIPDYEDWVKSQETEHYFKLVGRVGEIYDEMEDRIFDGKRYSSLESVNRDAQEIIERFAHREEVTIPKQIREYGARYFTEMHGEQILREQDYLRENGREAFNPTHTISFTEEEIQAADEAAKRTEEEANAAVNTENTPQKPRALPKMGSEFNQHLNRTGEKKEFWKEPSFFMAAIGALLGVLSGMGPLAIIAGALMGLFTGPSIVNALAGGDTPTPDPTDPKLSYVRQPKALHQELSWEPNQERVTDIQENTRNDLDTPEKVDAYIKDEINTFQEVVEKTEYGPELEGASIGKISEYIGAKSVDLGSNAEEKAALASINRALDDLKHKTYALTDRMKGTTITEMLDEAPGLTSALNVSEMNASQRVGVPDHLAFMLNPNFASKDQLTNHGYIPNTRSLGHLEATKIAELGKNGLGTILATRAAFDSNNGFEPIDLAGLKAEMQKNGNMTGVHALEAITSDRVKGDDVQKLAAIIEKAGIALNGGGQATLNDIDAPDMQQMLEALGQGNIREIQNALNNPTFRKNIVDGDKDHLRAYMNPDIAPEQEFRPEPGTPFDTKLAQNPKGEHSKS